MTNTLAIKLPKSIKKIRLLIGYYQTLFLLCQKKDLKHLKIRRYLFFQQRSLPHKNTQIVS